MASRCSHKAGYGRSIQQLQVWAIHMHAYPVLQAANEDKEQYE